MGLHAARSCTTYLTRSRVAVERNIVSTCVLYDVPFTQTRGESCIPMLPSA